MSQKPASFTISLDFELYWGMRDKINLDSYRENLLGVWSAIPKMLALFEQYQIHVTWATVGILFLENEKVFIENNPEILPSYEDRGLCPYVYFDDQNLSKLDMESFRKMHFARELIDIIIKTPFQEVATHTYSHYYTREPNLLIDAFESDLNKAMDIANENSITLNSLVFPRNQIDSKTINTLKKAGIKTYRGNPKHWAYCEGESGKHFLQRVYRFFDIYINLSGMHTSIPHVDDIGLIEVKSSMFMRAYSKKFKALEYLKLRRIKHAMTQAAKKGENFHLWWHPHNFGLNLEKNMANLAEILEHFNVLKERYGMLSLNMHELGEFYE